MQSLLVLTTVIALMATYLDTMEAKQPGLVLSPKAAKIIRTHAYSESATHAYAQTVTVETAITEDIERLILPLNLRLPTRQDLQWRIQSSQQSNPNLFQKTSRDDQITYSAELVFDADKGEDITGGKVNIKIPLS